MRLIGAKSRQKPRKNLRHSESILGRLNAVNPAVGLSAPKNQVPRQTRSRKLSPETLLVVTELKNRTETGRKQDSYKTLRDFIPSPKRGAKQEQGRESSSAAGTLFRALRKAAAVS